MRQTKNPQLQLGAVDIAHIELDPKSRDDIPQLLAGLQYIYLSEALREAVFKILEASISADVSHHKGRPGMELWKILVLGTIRLNVNCDYDRLHELVNQHQTIRAMLGHDAYGIDSYQYQLQTLKDNVGLLTPELLQKVNQVIVQAGHAFVKESVEQKSKENKRTAPEYHTTQGMACEDNIQARCDTFVVKTHVHYPTDISLLWDAARKFMIELSRLCAQYELTEWRQIEHQLKKLKRLWRQAQSSKRSKGKDAEKKKKQAYQKYLSHADSLIVKARLTLEKLRLKKVPEAKLTSIIDYIKHAVRQVEQTRRRVLEGQVIPTGEKVYSIFQNHTEWVSKGKAGVPVELGLKVCVMECQHGFILHHRVMEDEQDVDVAVIMAKETKNYFPGLSQVSYDKGFHSPQNQIDLANELDTVVLPKKGKLSEKDKEREHSDEFKRARKQHSAVESAINALEVHGLDVCPDHGIEGFKRYVALAVVARNIQRLGVLVRQQAQVKARKLQKKQRHFKQAA